MGNLLDAVQHGDKRQVLDELLEILSVTIMETTSSRDIAALVKRFLETYDARAALPDPDDLNPVDDMARLVAEYDEYEDERGA